jgi:2'-5' RNA ligase
MPVYYKFHANDNLIGMKRIFIAVKVIPEAALLSLISSLKAGLKNEDIRWVDHENIHITLAFPGNTDEEKIAEIDSVLEKKCEGFGKFELKIRGAGVFKSQSDPRVIWAGIEPLERLDQLNLLIKNSLAEAEVRLEDRPFKPHLTLGRIKNLRPGNTLSDLINKFKESDLQIVPVNEIIMYESILRQQGPLYKPLEKFQL